jgi:enoyl-CoA hydratase/carnithine racemase
MAMSGDAIDAKTASSGDLSIAVVPTSELDAATSTMIRRVTRGSAASKGIGKRAFYEQIEMDQDDAYAYATDIMSSASLDQDAQESMNAFIEKRQPHFGRPPRTD